MPGNSTIPRTAKLAEGAHVIPLTSETANVTIKQAVTGAVHVSTNTTLQDVLINEALTRHHAHVERVEIGRIVETAPEIREVDGILIIPVIEEIAVVEKRLFLKEEVRIHRGTTTHHHQETVTLRQQEAVVHRTSASLSSDAPQTAGASSTPEEIIREQ